MVTIKTNKKHRANKGCIIGGVEIKFDKYCMADVAEHYVEEVLKSDPSLELVEEEDLKKYAELKKQAEENSKSEVADVDVHDENTKLKSDIKLLEEEKKLLIEENTTLKEEQKVLVVEIEGLKKQLGPKEVKYEVTEQSETQIEDEFVGLKKADLIKICEELDLPKEEWKDLNVEPLRDYTREKYNKLQSEQGNE